MSTDLNNHAVNEDEAKKPSPEILRQEIEEGLGALERSAGGLFISGVSAGLDIGFSLFVMAVTWTLFESEVSAGTLKLLVANAYAVGFLFVILGRSELFTEQTTLAVLPVLNGKAGIAALLRLWGLVYIANLLGTAAFALLTTLVGPALGMIDSRAFGEIAAGLIRHPGWVIFASAVLAGWLMGLLSWLVASGRDTISQVVLVWLVATVIGLCGLHHVVVGSAEVLAGLFADQGVTAADYGRFLLWTTLGNAVGGSFFVAFIKYSLAIRTGPAPDHTGTRVERGERRSLLG